MPQIEPSADDAALRATLRNALQDELAQMPPDAGLAELHMRLQADAVAGPDETSRWTLAVPIAQRDSALARLRASPLVDAAEAP